MAKRREVTDAIPRKKPKVVPGMKYIDEYLVPHSAADVASYLIPYGKVAKAGVKVLKAAAKSKKVKTVVKGSVAGAAAVKAKQSKKRTTIKINKKVKS